MTATMTMHRRFDKAAAWRELARPAYDALPEDFLLLFWRVARAARGLKQNPVTRLLPWPSGVTVKDFGPYSNYQLGMYAHVAFRYGEWSHAKWRVTLADPPPAERRSTREFDWKHEADGFAAMDRGPRPVAVPVVYGHHVAADGGAHWRFANYADQVLMGRLNVPVSKARPAAPGLHYRVENGFLVAYLVGDGEPLAVPLGPPPESMVRLRAAEVKPPRAHPSPREWFRVAAAWAEEVLRPGFTDPAAGRWLAASERHLVEA